MVLDTPKLDVKIYLEPPLEQADRVALDDFLPVFHDWIKHQRLDETLIDVADYRHVDRGPGILLIGHQADYAIDATDGRLGILYSRKRGPVAETLEERLQDGIVQVLRAAYQLEQTPELAGKVRASASELWLRIRDRLQAPNDDTTWSAFGPTLDTVVARLFPGDHVVVERETDPKAIFGVRIKAGSELDVESALGRLRT